MNNTTKSLTNSSPYLGRSSFYSYNGNAYEGARIGNCYALHLFTEGRGFIMIEGTSYPVEYGTLIFIRPGQNHSFHIDQSPLNAINLYFDLWEEADDVKSAQPQFALYPRTLPSATTTKQEDCTELDRLPTQFMLPFFPALMDGLHRIQHLFDHSVHYRAETVNSLLYAWFLQWFNAVEAPRPVDKRISRIILEMERAPDCFVSYEEWCRKCGLNKSYFYSLFKQETGLTPKAFLLRIKMKKAAALLLESNLSITAISEQLGYKSIHYFSNQFQSYYKVTPTSYRGR